MADYSVKILKDKDELSQWDELVNNYPERVIFHERGWLESSQSEIRYYGCYAGEALVAGLAIAKEKRFGNWVATMPPLTPYLGIIWDHDKSKYVTRLSKQKNISSLFAQRLKQDFAFVSIRFLPGLRDIQSFFWEGYKLGVRYTYIINLSQSLEEIWLNMDAKRRNDIRKAEKDGLYVKRTSTVVQVYQLVDLTFKRQSRIFGADASVLNCFNWLGANGKCQFFVTKNAQGNDIAGVGLAWDHETAYYLIGGYDYREKHHGGSALALWEAIKYSKEALKLKRFDFEGSMVPDIERFFREFGGELTPYFTADYMTTSYKIRLFLDERRQKYLRRNG